MLKQKGFSLIELMIAITIIGILIATTAIGITKSQQHTRNAQRIGDITLLSKAIDQVSIQNGVYPDVTKYLDPSAEKQQTIIGRDIDAGVSPISKIDLSVFASGKIPSDPKPGIVYKTSGQPSDHISRRVIFEYRYNILNGYIYSKNTMTKSEKNPADQLQANYTLEVGLEEGDVNDYQIQSSEDTRLDALSENVSYGVRFEHQKTIERSLVATVKQYGTINGSRYRYILVGPLCGENCPL